MSAWNVEHDHVLELMRDGASEERLVLGIEKVKALDAFHQFRDVSSFW